MKRRIIILLGNFIFWVLFFVVARALFLLYQFKLTSTLPASDIALIFFHGLRMDMSMAGYFSLIPGLLLGFVFFTNGKRLWQVWWPYQTIIALLATLVVVVDLELYGHWGFRMDATPLLYLGKEAAGSGDPLTSVLLVALWLTIVASVIYFQFRLFKPLISKLDSTRWIAIPTFLFLTSLFIIPIRGSFGVAPMNTGFVYFHDKNIYANHAAVNVVWNFGYALQKFNNLRYNDNFFDRDKTESLYREMFPLPQGTKTLLNQTRPNVMIILLESYTYRFIERLGGIPGVAPRFEQLIKEGVLFDNFYASGDRTDKGIVAVLNGYPAQPVTSIIKEPKKTKSLPYLNKFFKDKGYRTEFTYGYNINYANFKSYLLNGDFNHITHSADFPQELNTSKWGVHDHYVFQKFFEEAQASPEPFFKVMMTQSSHEPFDVPMETVIKGEDDVNKFLNSAHYTDKSLGNFIDKSKLEPWWKNTLIIITADHGHHLPDSYQLNDPNRFRVPMLWLGGALSVKDTVIHTLGNQVDIPNTLLGQLNQNSNEFKFSHDLLSSNFDPLSVYIYNNGFGLINNRGKLVFDNVSGEYIVAEKDVTELDKEKAKAFVQMLYWDFNSR